MIEEMRSALVRVLNLIGVFIVLLVMVGALAFLVVRSDMRTQILRHDIRDRKAEHMELLSGVKSFSDRNYLLQKQILDKLNHLERSR